MSKTKEVRPFGLRDKIGYMCGDLANDFSFIFASSYVMVFYTKVMGISAGMVGTMFLVARCLDAFTDIGMGRIVDNISFGDLSSIHPSIFLTDLWHLLFQQSLRTEVLFLYSVLWVVVLPVL